MIETARWVVGKTLVAAGVLSAAGCGGSGSTPAAAPSSTARPATSAKVQPPLVPGARDASLQWWQGLAPDCSVGTLEVQSTDKGRVLWCQLEGQSADANLQNDLSRIAACVTDVVRALGQEPVQGELGSFAARSEEAGIDASLCSAVRQGNGLLTYHGRRVHFERLILRKELAEGGGAEATIQYRFSCVDCQVASEAVVRIPTTME